MNISADSALSAPSFEAVFEHIPYGALVVQRDGTIWKVNKEFSRQLHAIFGWQTFEGALLSDLVVKRDKNLLDDLFAAASGGRLTLQFASTDGGKARPFHFRVSALRDYRRVTHFVLCNERSRPIDRTFQALNEDLRAANALSAEMRRQNQNLRVNVDDLESFSYYAAHDMKAPLRNIDTLLNFLEADHGSALTRDAQDLIGKARSCAVRMQRLISGLVEHARSGTAPIDRQAVDICETLDAVTENLSTTLEKTGARMVVPGAVGTINADPLFFHQLLENLVSNALKYRASTRQPLITIRRQPTPQGDSLTVSDNGVGFSDADAQSLFEAFRRLGNPSRIEGSGIGLATCQRICERHGWSIAASGVLNQGATFTISGIS